MASTGRAMEKPAANQDHHQHPLNCPRCDSTNTKFCYYNNYSLSQPRHFCKACKRYWTRGGTLRNVPVGGGCRKNKRVKRPTSSSAGGGDATTSSAPPSVITANPSAQLQTSHIDLPSNSNNNMNPLFYNNLPSSHHLELNLPYSNTVSGFNQLQPQINALGLGFSSGLFLNNNNNGFNSSKQLIQDVITPSSSILSSNPIFGYSSTTFASTFQQQQKFMNSTGLKDHTTQGLISQYEDHLQGNGGNSAMVKEVKTEGNQNLNRLENWNISNENHIAQMINSSSDPSFLWNTTGVGVGAWLDPSNMGSSVSSLM